MGNIFVDDNFIGNKKEAKALLVALATWQAARGYPIEFMTEAASTWPRTMSSCA